MMRPMSGFEEAFGVPTGHGLRQVHPASCAQAGHRQAGAEARRWEHEEYDRDDRLVAADETWTRAVESGGGGVAFVRYSPYGRVLGVFGRSARLPTPPTRHRPVVEAA
jgi:hypothetical protein